MCVNGRAAVDARRPVTKGRRAAYPEEQRVMLLPHKIEYNRVCAACVLPVRRRHRLRRRLPRRGRLDEAQCPLPHGAAALHLETVRILTSHPLVTICRMDPLAGKRR